jgi:hypothetical protein
MGKNLYDDFSGAFGDFETFFHDVDFDCYVIRFWNEEGDSASYKQVIGYTELNDGDIMLHIVDAECADTFEEIEENANKYGVEFRLLSNLLRAGGLSAGGGFEISPVDQPCYDDDDDEDDGDDCDCDCCDLDNDDEPWTCHCGNVNEADSLFCLKCDCMEDDMDDDCEYRSMVEFGDVLQKVGNKFKDTLSAEVGFSIENPSPKEMNEFLKTMTGALKDLLED